MAEKKPSPFAYVDAVMSDVGNALNSGKLPIDGLNRFMLIRGCMLHKDTILAAEAANKLTHMPDSAVFSYLHASIMPKTKRFSRMPRQAKMSDEQAIHDLAIELEISTEDARFAINFVPFDDDIPF